ncbi:MerR family transcriptional regulator [Mobilitalea sibirica]|uniref:MerR family transcriptional regulator n=1 Tax=Mobilitalea sibirica TaxID=1462919 RepID=A0A8J7H6A8_9FIRM|nr:MerR family transcriptional regulator [Mobilitalea sibirica]MBH1942314.1 MerR family transcriptional regulator [Mobilitalea sibirica]
MEYTVQKLGNLAGISTRTLRYYDEIGILKPARINSSGYRIYGQKEVDLLQQIMFFRELGISLDEIKGIIFSASYDKSQALKEHHEKLLAKRQQLDLLIANVEKTILYQEGRFKMSDKEKFEGFKKSLIDENEKKYGKEIREKYGEDKVKASNQRMMNMTKEQYEEFEILGKKVMESLEAAFATGDPGGELGQETAELHREWLSFTWENYSKEAHFGLATMYVEDERFRAFYDKDQPGRAEFLRDAISIYTGIKA